MRTAGDVNGDGFDDVLIAADWGDPNGIVNAGHVYLVFGEPNRMITDVFLPGLDGTNGVILNGVEELAHFGRSASSLGDVNGDGYGDIVVGAPESDAIFPRGGRAFVIFGGPEFFTSEINVSDLDGSNGFAVDPAGNVDLLGTTVRAAGDVNGDGYDDILVAAPWAYDPVSQGFGQAYIIYGGPQGSFPATISVTELNGNRGFVFTGRTEISYAFAQDSSGVGDINGDGFDYLIVSDSGADSQA